MNGIISRIRQSINWLSVSHIGDVNTTIYYEANYVRILGI